MGKVNLIKTNLEYSYFTNSFDVQIEANHNKDYSVVKTFKAGGNSRFLFVMRIPFQIVPQVSNHSP
jgi:hypothetical protein